MLIAAPVESSVATQSKVYVFATTPLACIRIDYIIEVRLREVRTTSVPFHYCTR